MPAYVLVHIDVKDPEPYEEYKKMAPASIAQYGGRYIVRGPTCSTGELVLLEGV
jgi:uncharacterized protein (DUF1330 family)